MNRMDMLTGERTRAIGPGVGHFRPNPILAGITTADMLYDRPVALRDMERPLPNLTSNEPRLRSIENPTAIPDLSLRHVPPNMVMNTPAGMEITQNDVAHYAVPKRSQFPDETIQTRRMLELYGDRVPPSMKRNPAEQAGMIGPDNESYLRVPKRMTTNGDVAAQRMAQDTRFYGTWTTIPSDLNDVSRRRMAGRGDFAQLQVDDLRAFDHIDVRNQVMYTRVTTNPASNVDAAFGARGTRVLRGVTSGSAGFPIDSRRS
jgi:hypothetical protein